ncbi:bifunctional nicotinamidase/pyrazinamidase [Vibrio porteresiae]|uniref:nicotinamidase n=1 Tax=Vibrio porteresiae DSM 19223 TaxID=1123496 RepID=A0ABZ0QGL3_9VIBR|nr:bifunctional nicotinamidase/pyrazinamidase [Vibrio porteresiae]WPC75642.1 bifunctional nicotinamidase/pyrazinamidase [Vibrio porteresiae DSM 19223]
MTQALILVDVQNDFAPGGSLAVPQGDHIVPVINRLLPHFEHVIATKDWHPVGHASFASTHGEPVGSVIDLNGMAQMMWPDHCVQHTSGAAFIPSLNRSNIEHVIFKGTQLGIDSYSGFFDNQRLQATGLEEYLREHNYTDIYIVGLATDYCVKFTALDSVSCGFNTFVISDACRGVNIHPEDSNNALEEMKNAGCHIVTSAEVLAEK